MSYIHICDVHYVMLTCILITIDIAIERTFVFCSHVERRTSIEHGLAIHRALGVVVLHMLANACSTICI
jgi:hypothetical protein